MRRGSRTSFRPARSSGVSSASRHAAAVQGRTAAASAPRGGGRGAGSRGQLPRHGHHRVSKCLGYAVRAASRRRCARRADARPNARAADSLRSGAGAVQERRRQLPAGADARSRAIRTPRSRWSRRARSATRTPRPYFRRSAAVGGTAPTRPPIRPTRAKECCQHYATRTSPSDGNRASSSAMI